MDLHRRAARLGASALDGVSQQADRQDVVEMRMRDQDMVDLGHRLHGELGHAAAGVDEHIVVQQEGGGPVAGRQGAGATEHANLHAGDFRGRLARR